VSGGGVSGDVAAVEVSGLKRVYAATRGLFGRSGRPIVALDGVDFTIARGEVFGLLGPNGAGKTTTVKVLATLLTPTAGTARVLGFDVVRQTARVRPLINFVFGGERSLYWRLSAWDNLQFFADLYRVPRRVQKRLLPDLLELVGLSDRARDRVETFSKGMKQRLNIARGLVNDPEVLFLDEPTLGLDPVASQDLRSLVSSLRDAQKAVLLTTHYMFEAEQLCDRVAIIDRGRIIALDTPSALKRHAAGLSVLEITAFGVTAGDLEAISALGCVATVSARTIDQRQVVLVQTEDAGQATPLVLEALRGRKVEDVRAREASLEDAYLRLVGGRG